MELKFKNVVFHDTETTGTNPEDRIIETAHLHFNENGQFSFKEELCKAPVNIKPAAAMTHGYRNSQVKDKPSFDKLESAKTLKKLAKDGKTYYVAHNAPFDLQMLKKEGIEWPDDRVIDTLIVAQHVYKDDKEVEMYKLQYFRYLHEYDDQPWFAEAMKMLDLDEIKPHTALSDIFILMLFYKKLQEDFGLTNEDMVRLSQTPVEEKTLDFGNLFEKGKYSYDQIAEMKYEQWGRQKDGFEYLEWAAQNMNMSASREFTIKKALANAVLKSYRLKKETVNALANGQTSQIPFSKGKNWQKWLFWGIAFVFEGEDLNLALEAVGQSESFKEHLYNVSKKRLQEAEELLANAADDEQEQDAKKKIFLNKYLVNFRKEVLLG